MFSRRFLLIDIVSINLLSHNVLELFIVIMYFFRLRPSRLIHCHHSLFVAVVRSWGYLDSNEIDVIAPSRTGSVTFSYNTTCLLSVRRSSHYGFILRNLYDSASPSTFLHT